MKEMLNSFYFILPPSSLLLMIDQKRAESRERSSCVRGGRKLPRTLISRPGASSIHSTEARLARRADSTAREASGGGGTPRSGLGAVVSLSLARRPDRKP